MGCKKNQTIRCTVDQCKHHEKTENFCALDSITVGTHEANPTMDQCTDCLSFEKQSKYKGALYKRARSCVEEPALLGRFLSYFGIRRQKFPQTS